jgi:hypothetical protein
MIFNHYREVVTSEEAIVYLGSPANEEQLEKSADEFLLGDPEIINPALFSQRRYQLTVMS